MGALKHVTRSFQKRLKLANLHDVRLWVAFTEFLEFPNLQRFQFSIRVAGDLKSSSSFIQQIDAANDQLWMSSIQTGRTGGTSVAGCSPCFLFRAQSNPPTSARIPAVERETIYTLWQICTAESLSGRLTVLTALYNLKFTEKSSLSRVRLPPPPRKRIENK